MENLNDRIEGIFRGIVFISLSFVASIVRMLCWPLRGYVALIAELRRKMTNQVRPYAFVFIAVVVALFAPPVISSLSPKSVSPFEFQVFGAGAPKQGALGRAYQETTREIESKAAAAIFLAAIVGVAAFHLGSTGLGVLLFRPGVRRKTWQQAFFFIGGFQVSLFILVALIDNYGLPPATEIQRVVNFLLSPYIAVYAFDEPRSDPAYLDVLRVALMVILLAVPTGMTIRFGARAHRWSGPSRRLSAFRTVLLVLVIDVAVISSYSLAAYTADEIQPREKPKYPFVLDYLACKLDDKAIPPIISGNVMVTAERSAPWSFEEQDFQLFVAADRIDTEAPPRRARPTLAPHRIGAGRPIPADYKVISPALSGPPFLLQAGQAALIAFTVPASPELLNFLLIHPQNQRCTLHYTQDIPIGAIGVLATHNERIIRSRP